LVNQDLVGRCGIYCGSCGFYRAYKDQGEYLQRVSNEWEIPVEKIRCEGCHALTPSCLGSECRIVQCLDSKVFDYCFECSEYAQKSCEKHNELSARWAADSVDLRANLERVKAGEIGAWLKECEKQFSCSSCGKPLPVLGWNVMKKCYHCGLALSKKKQSI